MYAAVDDPYLYSDTSVLKNIPDIRDPVALARFEAISIAARAEEPLPTGRYSKSHFLAIHRHLFQDVYRWAGKPRTIRMSKGGNTFCYPEHIDSELRRLFDWLRSENYLRNLSSEQLAARLAYFLSELNAIHAFREGNGRTQLAFAFLLSSQAGHPLDLRRLDPKAFLEAMVIGFAGHEKKLATLLMSLI
jgi:cell filamentation protein